MNDNPVRSRQVTREELYEQVWAKPVRTVAAEYGVSDVGLAKACKRLNVPRPPVGYWARLQHGKTVERPPLPPAEPGQPTMTTVGGTSSTAAKPNVPAGVPRPEIPTVVVGERLTKPHPAVQVLVKLLRDAAPDKYGALVITGAGGPAFRTSPGVRDRALRILDTLFKALEARGHRADATESVAQGYHRGHSRMKATVNGQDVDVSISERMSQRAHMPKAKPTYVYEPRYDYVSTGKLVLHVGSRWSSSSYQRTWQDGDRQRLEHLLGQVVLAFELAAAELIQQQQERERREREHAEAVRREAILQARVDYEKILAADLTAMADAWAKAKHIREFISAVEERLPADAWTDGTRAWLVWARQHAIAMDPLREPNKVPKRLEPNV